jgi:eukaryotic-like serine/threonine-protein kinase
MSSAAEVSPVISYCPHCSGAYDGTGLKIGQEITCPHCEQALKHSLQFGDYRLLKKLGAGGMGIVYLADDLQLERKVAVKILNKKLSGNIEFIATFLQEAETTATLEHPNIVQVYSFGQHEGQYYLVMECLPGGSFDDLLVKHTKLPETQCLEIGIGAAAGLQFAADRGLVHRDVKPGNILFNENGVAKVVDFGLSLRVDAQADLENNGEIWGTPYYLPPERLNGQPEDFRSDMYAIAASLFHALAGRAPYEDKDPAKIALRHREGSAVRIQMFNPQLSEKTAYTIDKAMSRDPRQRFSSYDEFIDHLSDAKRLLVEGGGKAPVKKKVENIAAKSERSQGLLVMMAVLLIVGLGAAVWVFRDKIFSEKNAPTALDGYEPGAVK